MASKNEMSRRSMLRTGGVGLGAMIAGLEASDALAAKSCCASGTSKSKTVCRTTYHHIGVPTQKKHKNEKYLDGGKVYITDPEKDPYRIEWCRWLPESKDPKLLRTTVHIAFQVDCVETEIKKYKAKEIFLKPFVPFEGVKVAFIQYEGQLIEFIEKTA